ncbi:MAG: flavodoxin family protein, partial [Candidatus Kerfeldbacteria bacterium]|nr:flavodoxin family protein [Candidatus Kerfeldbacteria bacterium]
MRILILYGTNSGGTFAASQEVRGVFEQGGHSVELLSAGTATPDHLAQYDLVVLASCTWEKFTPEHKRLDGQLQEHFDAFIRRVSTRTFPGRRFSVMGFGDETYDKFCAAADHLEMFVQQIHGTKIGPTLRLGGYPFNVEGNQKIVQD